MPLIQRDYVIEQVPPDDPNQPFTNAILPGAVRRDAFRLDVAVRQELLEALIFKGRVVVVKQVLGLVAERRGVAHLLGHPSGSWVVGDGEVFDFAAAMVDHQKNIQGLE